MKRHSVLLTLIVFLFSAGIRAGEPQAPVVLTLDEAVRMALDHNRDVQKAREQVELLKGRIREVRAQAFPSVKIDASAFRYRDPAFLNSSSFDKIPPEFKNALTAAPANSLSYGLSFSQPIYTAGKVGTAIRLANIEMEGVNADLDKVEQDVTLSVVRTFYDLLLAQKRRVVALDTVEQRRQHLAVVKSRFAAGDATEVDVLRSQVNLANAEPELIRADNAIAQARASLNHLLVRDPGAPLEIRGEFQYVSSTETDLDALAVEALRRRPELSRLRILDREADQQENLAQAESRMKVDFNGFYGISSRLPRNLVNADFQRWNFTLNFSLPLFDGGRRSGLVEQAASNHRVARLSLQQQESSVRLEVQQALDEIRRAEKTVEAMQMNVAQAERVLTMMQNNFRYGAATTLDVVDAQSALTGARTNLLQGLYDDVIGKARLRWVLGRHVLADETVKAD